MTSTACRRVALSFAIAFATVSCGSGDSDSVDSVAAADGSTVPAPSSSTPSESGDATFNSADLDRLERGLRREIELVQDAQRRSGTATTAQDRGRAMQDAYAEATIPRAAESVGMPVERYRVVRETVDRVLTTLDFQEKIDGPMSVDTARADAALRARLTSDPFAELSSESAAPHPRPQVKQYRVWIEYKTLTAVAG
jgi:hypothetical protein